MHHSTSKQPHKLSSSRYHGYKIGIKYRKGYRWFSSRVKIRFGRSWRSVKLVRGKPRVLARGKLRLLRITKANVAISIGKNWLRPQTRRQISRRRRRRDRRRQRRRKRRTRRRRRRRRRDRRRRSGRLMRTFYKRQPINVYKRGRRLTCYYRGRSRPVR